MSKFLLVVLAVVVACAIGVGVFFVIKNNRNSLDKNNSDQVTMVSEGAEYLTYSPVRVDDIVNPPKMYGIWPYGIKGSNSSSHNEGHPGWDFELVKGAKVYAVSDLTISQIHDGDKQSGDEVVKVIETQATLKGNKYHIVYHSVTNIESYVFEGAEVKAGVPLADAGYPLSETTRMIHFGIFQPNDTIGSCPLPYFTESVQEIINKIVSISRDYYTGQPYSSACVGKINRKIYEENYPDQIKNLGGAEQFE